MTDSGARSSHLQRALVGLVLAQQVDTLLNASTALRLLPSAVADRDCGEHNTALVHRLHSALLDVSIVLAAECDGEISAGDIDLGTLAAIGLVEIFGHSPDVVQQSYDQALLMDFLDHIAVFADRLDIVDRQRSIRARGDIARRIFATRRAMAGAGDLPRLQ